MHRPILILAAVLFLPISAAGQQAPAPSGRYQIAPDEDGFVRLDTRTGAMTHCGKREGAWRCDVLAEERSDLERRLDDLAGKVDALTAELDRLTASLSAIQKGEAGPSAEDRDEELDEALSFAERLMRRFFDLVRELKSETPTRT